MDRLQAVADVGQRAPDDDRHRVVEIRRAHLLLEPARLDVAAADGVDRRHRQSTSYTSRLVTRRAFSSMNARRGSTWSPISIENTQVGGRGVLHRDLHERARRRIHRRLAQLLGVHLAEALEAVVVDALLGDRRAPRRAAPRTRAASVVFSPSVTVERRRPDQLGELAVHVGQAAGTRWPRAPTRRT